MEGRRGESKVEIKINREKEKKREIEMRRAR